MKKFSTSLMNKIAAKRRIEERQHGLIVVNEQVLAEKDARFHTQADELRDARHRIAVLERQQRQQQTLVANEASAHNQAQQRIAFLESRVSTLQSQLAGAQQQCLRLADVVTNSAESGLRQAVWANDEKLLLESLSRLFFEERGPMLHVAGVERRPMVLWGSPLTDPAQRQAIVTDGNTGERIGSVTANCNGMGKVESVTIESQRVNLNIDVLQVLGAATPTVKELKLSRDRNGNITGGTVTETPTTDDDPDGPETRTLGTP